MLSVLRRSIRFCYFAFIRAISSFVVEVIYADIFEYKKECLEHGSAFKEKVYYAYLQKYNSWIGLNSTIQSKPNLPHGLNGIFISDRAVIGHQVTIFHQVTIGSNTLYDSKLFGSPVIGDNVYIGCGAKIIGKVKIGDFVRIGANCCVVKDIEHHNVVVAGENRVIKKESMNNEYILIEKIK